MKGISTRVHYTPNLSSPCLRELHDPGGRVLTAAKRRAANLICLTRDESADTIGAALDRADRQDLYALCVVLAAMVPDDKPMSELLAWIDRLEVAA